MTASFVHHTFQIGGKHKTMKETRKNLYAIFNVNDLR